MKSVHSIRFYAYIAFVLFFFSILLLIIQSQLLDVAIPIGLRSLKSVEWYEKQLEYL